MAAIPKSVDRFGGEDNESASTDDSGGALDFILLCREIGDFNQLGFQATHLLRFLVAFLRRPQWRVRRLRRRSHRREISRWNGASVIFSLKPSTSGSAALDIPALFLDNMKLMSSI